MINVNVNTGQPIYDLITILEDAKKGYLNAAEKTKDNISYQLYAIQCAFMKIRLLNPLRFSQ